MVKHPLRIAGTAGALPGLALVVFMVVGGSDLGFGSITVMGALVGVAVFVAALVVLWAVETSRESRS